MRLTTKYYQLEYKNAAVRWIKSGEVEIIRMIYPGVRDHNWGTLEAQILKEKIDQNDNGFEVEVLVRYQKSDIHFDATVKIIGSENYLSFEMNGIAKSTFKTCRVGICVLHPIKECSGKSCDIFHTDGTSETIFFPGIIAPYQPMKNINRMKWGPSEEIQVQLGFSGDVFELEDQRNWTDASYKTYSRPLELTFPFKLEKGDKIYQKVELSVKLPLDFVAKENRMTFKIDKSKQFKIPKLGTCVSSRDERITENEIEILKMLPFDHLRYELKLFNEKWEYGLQKAINESNLFGWTLFLVIYFSDNYLEDMKQLKSFLYNKEYSVGNILIVGKDHLSIDKLLNNMYDVLKSIFKNVVIGTGVNAYFAELNRNRPQSLQAEFINFTICPQVHAFDSDSLIENLEAQKYVIESAKKLFSPKLIYVSPVTLKQRFNVVATSDDASMIAGELPAQVDLRQNSLFAAQWLLGSLKFLSQSGTALVTFFETVGWRGFIQGGFEPPMPEIFRANAGDIFPIYYLLKEFKGYNNVIYSESNFPLDVDGIVLQNNEMEVKLIIANFSDKEKIIDIESSMKWSDNRTLLGNDKLIKIKDRIILPPNAIAISKGL